MSSKVKRKVTVENSKEREEQPRRPSVFERLGPNATDRHSRTEQNEKCRNWLRTGICSFGNTCRYQHDPFPVAPRRSAKPEKEVNEKDLRHKVRTKRDEPKESRTGSVSPKRKGSKRSNSRSRKGEHESKIKSTVVVTRPRSPTSAIPVPEASETKKKGDGNWEDDSDDWPMDAAQLDYKEELTLERKRQQLQRELELELQREKLLNESVTVTKTVSFSESSSSSSSSDSGSISSTTESSSSSSGEDSDDSSSSSSSSSSSGSRPAAKRKNKKSAKNLEKSSEAKPKDDYDKIKSSRAAKAQKIRTPSPNRSKKGREKRNVSPLSPKRRVPEQKVVNVRVRGPRTPSPIVPSRKQRIWDQSSSADSRSVELQRGRGKRHKKKKDLPKNEKYKSDRAPTPPPLSSPNRTALMPIMASKKAKRDDSGVKNRHRNRDSSPLLLPRTSSAPIHPMKLLGNARYLQEDKSNERNRYEDRPKVYARKETENLLPQGPDSRERGGKRSKLSPRRETFKGSISPHKDRYEHEVPQNLARKMYVSPVLHDKDEKTDRRRTSPSPARYDRRKIVSEVGKKREVREISPRHDARRDQQYRETHMYDKRGTEAKVKRLLSPDGKKKREDRNREHVQKDRNVDYEPGAWADHRKVNMPSTGRRTPELRGRQEIRSQPSSLRSDPSRERDQDRKKKKDKDLPVRTIEESERTRLSPRRSPSPMHVHHGVREIESLTGNRGRGYDTDIPPGERDYAYGYDPLHDPYISDRLLPPEYDPGPPLYTPDVYPESRYRRDIKDPAILDRYGPREVISPRDMLPHRDIISLTGRNDDYLSDLPLDERSYDDRWPRGRGREDWDPYAAIPPAPLPPHVAAALDEDRYGMPRRRCASPEWPRSRLDDRDSSLGPINHRQVGRRQMPPNEGRSRSPPKGPGTNRGSWNERGGRNDSRSRDSRQDDSQKPTDDRKGRNSRKDRVKRKDDSSSEAKPPASSKDRATGKRPHSPSPPAKESKRRKEDVHTPESGVSSEKGSSSSHKKSKEDGKDHKSSRVQKSGKSEITSPKSDVSHNSALPQEKVDVASKNIVEVRGKEREERKPRRNDDTACGDDDFSDWSDGDDDLLNREDFVECEGNDNSKHRHRSDDKSNDDALFTNSKRRDKGSKDRVQELKKSKESSSRTSSKDRSNDVAHSKDSKSAFEGKDIDAQETFSLKEDTATDVDEYITAESVDYDPISDDELDALIEEPDDSIVKQPNETEKSKIVDALDVNWLALMNESKTEFVPGFARRRFKACHVLARIGFSQALAGPELSEKIVKVCQKEMEEEAKELEGENASNAESNKEPKFVIEHQIAAFHVAIAQSKKERANCFNKVGPFRRALCARRDLQIRKQLCKPTNKFVKNATVSFSPQYSIVDKDLYKQSLELLRRNSTTSIQPQPVNAC